MAKSIMSSVSFKEYYFEQLVYLEMQHSKSNFICELIKKHMEENGVSIPQEEIDNYIDSKNNKKKYRANIETETTKIGKETTDIKTQTAIVSPKKERDLSWISQ